MDDALARTGAARGQREYTLPTARAFAHMPTAFDHHEIQEDLNSKTGAVPHCDTASPSLAVTECGKERPVKCELVRETTGHRKTSSADASIAVCRMSGARPLQGGCDVSGCLAGFRTRR